MTNTESNSSRQNNDSTESEVINQEDIKRYLEFLGYGLTAEPSQPDSTLDVTFCGAWFDGKGERPIPEYGVWFGKVEAILKTYENLIQIGYKKPNFHVTLNETNDLGRRADHIEAPRVLCLDIDDENGDRAGVKKFIEHTKVQLCVESSPGKFHFYWAIERSISLDDWRIIQAGIAHRFKGDLNLAQINHVIRVPGFPRITKKGEDFNPRIVWVGPRNERNDRLELSLEDIHELFPGIIVEGVQALKEMESEARIEAQEAGELARAVIGQTLTEEGLRKAGKALGQEGKRNSGLYQAVKIYCKRAEICPSKVEAIEYGRALNDAMPRPLEESEVRVLSVKAWKKANKIRSKQEEDIRNAEEEIQKSAGRDTEYDIGQETQEESGEADRRSTREGTEQERNNEGNRKGATGEKRAGLANGQMESPSLNGSGANGIKRGKGGARILPHAVGASDDNHRAHGKKSKLSKKEREEKRLKKYELRIKAGAGGFEYDYSEEPLSLDRFSDKSVVARVLQRFEGKIVRVGRLLYAFDSKRRVWVNQKGSPTLLAHYASICAADTIHDPRFIRDLCLDRGRNVNPDAEKKWKRHFLSGALEGKVVGLLQTEHSYPNLQACDFDADPELLFCANGVLNMRTGELKEVRAEDYQLFSNRIEWNPDAPCEYWLQFLHEVFSENDEPEAMVDFMHEVFGYSLCGSVSAQKVFVHWGSGANGKSKLLGVLSQIMGAYAARMSCKSLSKTKNGFSKDVERVTVKSEGKRLLVLDDLETSTQWDEGLVKTFTADTLPMRKHYEEETDIPNRAKIHIGCNEPPSPESENSGLIRRLYLISYHRKFEPNIRVDQEINRRIKAELPGILRWAVEGYQRLVKSDFQFTEPQQISADMNAYRDEHFKLTKVLEDMFEPLPKSPKSIKKIMDSDDDWHDINALTEQISATAELRGYYEKVSTQWVSMQLKEQFFALKRRVKRGKKRTTEYYVRLKDSGKETI